MGQVKKVQYGRNWRSKRIKTVTIRETPIGALHLAEDIAAIGDAIAKLKTVDYQNITDKREFAEDMHRSTVLLLQTWKRYAELKLRNDYLVL